MGRETENLLNKRFNYRIFGGLLIVVAVAGVSFALYLMYQVLSSPFKRRGFGSTPVPDFSLFSLPMIKGGDMAYGLIVWGLAFVVIGAFGIGFLMMASNITKRLKARDDEVSHQILVEEERSKRDRARKR